MRFLTLFDFCFNVKRVLASFHLLLLWELLLMVVFSCLDPKPSMFCLYEVEADAYKQIATVAARLHEDLIYALNMAK